MSTDVERVRRENRLSEIAARYGVRLKKDGNEFIACCPLHADDTPSFTIFTGKDGIERFHCFGCGERGDVLDFVQKLKGVKLPEAIRILGGASAGPNVAPRRVEVRDVYAGIMPLSPAGEIKVGQRIDLYNPKRAGQKSDDGHDLSWGKFKPEMVFPYQRADGSLLGYVLRRTINGGGKETPMVMWCRLPDGRETWCRYPFPKPRPLYGLADLRDGQVIIVEGEKCRDALRGGTGRQVVTWPGGTYGIRHTDWSPLAGRSVVIWPDADAPGMQTADEIAAILHGFGCTVKILDVLGARAA